MTPLRKSILYHHFLRPPPTSIFNINRPASSQFGGSLNENFSTHFSSSSKLHRTRSFCGGRLVFLSKRELDHGFVNTQVLDSLKEGKFMFKTGFCGPVGCEFTQTRSFSDTITDPYPKPRDPRSSSPSSVESSQPIDAGSSIRKPISLWPGMYHSPVTNALWEARSMMFEKPGDKPSVSVSQSELVAKAPSESRTSILFKFSA